MKDRLEIGKQSRCYCIYYLINEGADTSCNYKKKKTFVHQNYIFNIKHI